jgi:hypothetical protein
MDPRTANQILLMVGVVVVWFVLEVVIRKGRMRWKAILVDGVIVAIVVASVLLLADDLSIRVLAVIIGILLMALLLLVLVFLVRSMGWIVGFRRKWLAMMGKPRIEAPDALLPDPVKNAVERFEAIGFERVTTTIDEGGSVVAHLLRADGVIAEAAVDPFGPGADVDYTSVLDGGRGTLVTSNNGLGAQIWEGSLTQAFPGATEAHLLDSHEDGLAFLHDRGIEPDPVSPDRLLAIRADLVARAEDAARAADPKRLRLEGARILQRQHRSVGRLRDRRGIEEELERFLASTARGDLSTEEA